VELPSLLSSLASLGVSDERLLRASADRLPDLLPDMNGRALAEFSAALAAAELWLPVALEQISDEAAEKLSFLRVADSLVLLAALAQLRWDRPPATPMLASRLAEFAPKLTAVQLGVALRALSRLPLAAACERGAAQRSLLQAVATVRLPGERSAPLGAADAAALAELCGALRHLRAEPPPRLVAHLAAVLPAASSAAAMRTLERDHRRALAKLADASREWAGVR